jgi:hypothetical protein
MFISAAVTAAFVITTRGSFGVTLGKFPRS